MSSSESAKVRFTVRAADPATEIFLINDDFALVDRGLSPRTFEQTPGAYKVKARLGSAIWEKAVLVRNGMPEVEVPHIEFASPSPIEGTALRHEHHVAALYGAATRPADVTYLGGGSAIVVMARDWTEKVNAGKKTSFADPSRGLVISTFDGTPVANIEQSSVKDLGWEPVTTCHVALPPGAYKLALVSPDLPPIEQTLIASPGWVTHVHLLMEAAGDDSTRHVDLAAGTISLRRPPPWNVEDLRFEDLARQALLEGRFSLADFLKSRLAAPPSPMFALYAAHLLIRQAQQAHYAHKEDEKIAEIDNKEPVAQAVDYLRAQLGDHPDVEAIAIGAGRGRADYRFAVPPMLRASWLLLLRESSQQAELIGKDSYVLRIAERIWGDGAWLLWSAQDPKEAAGRSEVWRDRAAELIAQWDVPDPSRTLETIGVSSIQSSAAASGASWVDSVKTYCNDAYRAVKSTLTRPASMPFPDLEKAAQKTAARTKVNSSKARRILSDPEFRKTLVRQTGIPINNITDWLDQLDKK